MSAKKKSFDVQPNARREKTVVTRIQKPKVRVGKPEPLRERRRKATMLVVWTVLFVFLAMSASVLYGLWRAEVRVVTIEAPSEYQESFERIVEEAMDGTYGYIVPRDSVFFFPQKEIRRALMEAHPEISAISIHRSSFTSLSISLVLRTTAFWWCGTPSVASAEDETCYKADAEGFIFARLPLEAYMGGEVASSTIPTGTTLRIYADIDSASTTDSSYLRARIKDLSELPNILAFVKELKTLSLIPVSLAIRGDEADLFLPSGTRLTYVLGDEVNAFSLLSTVADSKNVIFSDGSIRYLDLRFPPKIFLKRTGEE